MLIRLNSLLPRERASRAGDDRGASLILVIGLMAVGFIVASVIAASVLFTIGQTTQARGNVEAFAAAEAGRDVAMAKMAKSVDGCTDPHIPDGTNPQYEDVAIYEVTGGVEPTSADGLTPKCPTTQATYVVIRSTGVSSYGDSITIDSVYEIESYADRVAGGGLGFIDQSYTAVGVTYDGDVIVRNGNFSCEGLIGTTTTINGSVFVLNGSLEVPAGLSWGSTCSIAGDVITKNGVNVGAWCIIVCISTGKVSIGGKVKTQGAISVKGNLTATKNIETASTITTDTTSGASITSSTGAISAAGNITASRGSITASQGLDSGGSISGTVKGGAVSAVSTISGTITSTIGAVRANGNISGTVTAVTDITSRASISAGDDSLTAGGSIQALGSITTNKGAILATGGSVLASGDIKIDNASGSIRAGNTTGTTANSVIHAGGSINAKGTITAYGVTAVGSITTSAKCVIGQNIWAGKALVFSQAQASDSTGTKCEIQGWAKSAVTLSDSPNSNTLPKHSTSDSSKRSQVYVRGVVQSTRVWNSDGRYRNLAKSNESTTPATNDANIAAPGGPSVNAPELQPITFKLTDPDDKWRSFNDLELRTRWIDLGTKTRWEGYEPQVLSPCTATKLKEILATPGDKVRVDATQCGTLDLRGWNSVKLARDAVLLVNNVKLEFIRFEASNLPSGELRQFLIVQVDDKIEKVLVNGEYKARPDCDGRSDISITGSGFTWDTKVRALLYSPCGSNSVDVLSTWYGHLYVAKDATKDTDAELNVFTKLFCERIYIEDTIDLPCHVSEFGESGEHEEDFVRVGEMLSQTED